jgi:hypothetical protein
MIPTKSKKLEWLDFLPSHPSTFFSTAAACLSTSFAVVNIVPFTFLSTCVADVSTQIAELFRKLAVH